ncbi:MAG: small, acid-soluble spore protein, alpha/beta type [Eubacteriales bacterium]|nr:small, acid-soluble spore protein, alpha/beta type [Eubacteriales bacterium]
MAKKIKMTDLTPDEKMKYEIAEELGLLDRVLEEGWRTLSAKETGRIGGLMTKRKRMMKKEALQKNSV